MVIVSWFVSWLSAALTVVGTAVAITGLVGIALAVAGYFRRLRPAYLTGQAIGGCPFLVVSGGVLGAVAFWGGRLLRQPDTISNTIWLVSIIGHGWQSWRFASRRLLPTIMRGTHGVDLSGSAGTPAPGGLVSDPGSSRSVSRLWLRPPWSSTSTHPITLGSPTAERAAVTST